MPDVISHIQTFRDYFHYHIKASKVSTPCVDSPLRWVANLLQAYIHSRMRRRTADFLQGKTGGSSTPDRTIADQTQSSAEQGRTTRRRNARPPVGGRSRFRVHDCLVIWFATAEHNCGGRGRQARDAQEFGRLDEKQLSMQYLDSCAKSTK